MLDWFRTVPGSEPRLRSTQECHKCRLAIHYGPNKSGTYIYCPRCRASLKLPGNAVLNTGLSGIHLRVDLMAEIAKAEA
jgi:uncharacterized paraquat-inducible protein A